MLPLISGKWLLLVILHENCFNFLDGVPNFGHPSVKQIQEKSDNSEVNCHHCE